MQTTKQLAFIGTVAVATLTLAHYSRAQVVQGMTSSTRQYLDPGMPLFDLGIDHRGVQLEIRAHTWGLSAPGFSVDIWNEDPLAPELFDVFGAAGHVTIDGQIARFVSYGPTLERPFGGQRAIILPSWSTWPAFPMTGRDFTLDLHDPSDPSSRIQASADNVTG